MKLPEGFWRGFGPGLLWAASAIGVSHLVQSTRAGGFAGFGLTGVILLALILKYPFFEFGPRYAAATGRSLVEGYRDLGAWTLWVFFILTVVSSAIVWAAIIMFTAFLLQYLLGVSWALPVSGAIIIAVCVAILVAGHFKWLDLSIKLIMVALAVSTLIAAAVAVPRADLSTIAILPELGGAVTFGFLLALAGWMPTAIDISVWSSLWTLAKDRSEGTRASVATARLDFNIGYLGTGLLAFAFLMLGATVMYGSGQTFSNAGTAFSVELIELYVTTLGAWLKPIVVVAVFATMFSTALTVVDGYPRAIERSIRNLRGETPQAGDPLDHVYWVAIAVLSVTTMLVLWLFLGNLTTMLDFATIFMFITAPLLAWFNLRVVTSSEVPQEHRPGKALLGLSYVGIVVLGGTAVAYVVSLLR